MRRTSTSRMYSSLTKQSSAGWRPAVRRPCSDGRVRGAPGRRAVSACHARPRRQQSKSARERSLPAPTLPAHRIAALQPLSCSRSTSGPSGQATTRGPPPPDDAADPVRKERVVDRGPVVRLYISAPWGERRAWSPLWRVQIRGEGLASVGSEAPSGRPESGAAIGFLRWRLQQVQEEWRGQATAVCYPGAPA
jgi:hypothetical protein